MTTEPNELAGTYMIGPLTSSLGMLASKPCFLDTSILLLAQS